MYAIAELLSNTTSSSLPLQLDDTQLRRLVLQLIITRYAFHLFGDGKGHTAVDTDAKSANMLVMTDGQLKVSDLGNNIAYQPFGAVNSDSVELALLSTHAYSAPEMNAGAWLGAACIR